jgi:hypothetical protein
MSDLTLTIEPKVGFGEIKFGDESQKVIDILGEADEVENIEDEDGFNVVILNYWEKGVTVFFEGGEKSVVSCFETDIPETTLFGKEVFSMSEEEVIALMKEKGFEVAETEVEETGEKRISYDDALIDFFFEDGELIAINWGVLVNEKGEIEEFA